MSEHYGAIAFTRQVREVQKEHGSEDFYGRRADRGSGRPGRDPLGDPEREFLGRQDGFYLASVGETGWPYVQYRGGPPGFLRVVDSHTVGWADFRGNLQYVSVGNVAGTDRVAIIVMDYAQKRRLKLYGRATVYAADPDSAHAHALEVPGYDAEVERHVLVTVDAFDWNCPQHITARFTTGQVRGIVDPLRAQIDELNTEVARLGSMLAARTGAEAAANVVVHHTDGLHPRVDAGRADEPNPASLQHLCERDGLGAPGRH